LDAEFLLHDRDEDADRDPNLCLHRIIARAEEGFNTKVLLDPLEK